MSDLKDLGIAIIEFIKNNPMKKLFLLLCITALIASCATPNAAITGFGYENGKATVSGTLSVETPTNQEAETYVSNLTQGVFTYQHVRDSANVHFYEWKFISPESKNK